jgi:hypothetical protein
MDNADELKRRFVAALREVGQQQFMDVVLTAVSSLIADVSDLTESEVEEVIKENTEGGFTFINPYEDHINGSLSVLWFSLGMSFFDITEMENEMYAKVQVGLASEMLAAFLELLVGYEEESSGGRFMGPFSPN